MSGADVEAHWADNPRDNVGIRTGAPSGFFVLDLDPKNGGEQSWEALLKEHRGDFPVTRAVLTGSGGIHYYLAMPADFEVSNSARRLPAGLDIRGTGGLVVAPPSSSAIGPYLVLNDEETAPAPYWLLELLRPAAGAVDVSTVAQEDLPAYADLDEDDQDRLAGYASRAVLDEVERYVLANQGAGDTSLFAAACAVLEIAQSPWNLTTTEDAYRALDAGRQRRAVRAASYGGGQTDADFERIWRSARSRTAGRGRPMPPDPYAGVYFDHPFRGTAVDNGTAVATGGLTSDQTIQTEQTDGQTDPFAPLDWSELFSRDWGAIDWMPGKFVERGQQMALIGDGKSGKSLLVFEWAWRMAGGKGFLGDAGGRPLRVLYVDRENSQDDLYRRAVAFGATPEELAGVAYLSFPPFKPLDEDGSQFMAQVERHRPDVVILDTVSRFVAGKENESETWLNLYRQIHAQLKHAGITGVRLDHFGKDAEKGGRGSSAKSQDIDHVWELTAGSSTKATDGDHLVVTTGLTLRRTHTRSGRGTDLFSITRTGHKDPADEDWLPACTRHDLADASAGAEWIVAKSIATMLDEIGAPTNVSRDRARQLLRGKATFDNNQWSDIKGYRGAPPPAPNFVPIP